MVLHGVPPVPGRLRVYLIKEDSSLIFVQDTYSGFWDHSKLGQTKTLKEYIDELEKSGQHVAGLDYVIEADLLPSIQSSDFSNDSHRFFLANYDGKAWPLEELDKGKGYKIRINPTFFADGSEQTIKQLISPEDIRFDVKDIRVASYSILRPIENP